MRFLFGLVQFHGVHKTPLATNGIHQRHHIHSLVQRHGLALGPAMSKAPGAFHHLILLSADLGGKSREVQVCPYVFYEMCINSDAAYSLCRFDWNHAMILDEM